MARSGAKFRKRLVKTLLPPLRGVSPTFAARSLDAFGSATYTLSPAARARFRGPLESWSRALGCDWDHPEVARRMAGNELRWLSRDLVLDGLSDTSFDRMFHIEGRHHLDEARARGGGLLLLVSHYGSQMIPVHWMLRKDYPLRVYMERPNSISRFLAARFREEGPLGQAGMFISRGDASAAESATSIMRAVQVLKAGMVLCLAGDVRWSGAHTAIGRFLGVEQSFTATWAVLAGMARAVIVPAFSRMLPDGRYCLEFQPASSLPPEASSRRHIGSHVQHFLDRVEEQIRLDPSNAVEYLTWSELLNQPSGPASRPGVQAA